MSEDPNNSIKHEEDAENGDETTIPKEQQATSFECIICDKSHATMRSFNDHMKNHADANRNKCPICNQQSGNNYYAFATHIRIHSEDKPFKCDLCDHSFGCEPLLKKHQKKVHFNSCLLCSICKTQFEKKTIFMQQLESHNAANPSEGEDEPIRCDSCQKSYESEDLLNAHIKDTHSNHELIVCVICDKEFISNNAFQRHKQAHVKSNGNIFKCEQCDKVYRTEELLRLHEKLCPTCKLFGDRNSLRLHLVREKGYKQRKCEECDEIFCSVAKLKEHVQYVHVNLGIECPVCTEIFTTQYLFDIHAEAHKGEHQRNTLVKIHNRLGGGLQCIECGHLFLTENKLQKHTKTHDLKLQCITCGRLFKNELALEKHIKKEHSAKGSPKPIQKSPEKEKPFQCEICYKTYMLKPSLQMHMKVHLTDREWFYCSICHKQFTAKAFLKRHVAIHNEEKPFKCEQCGNGFGSEILLKNHMKRHGADPNLLCNICKEQLRTQRALAQHLATHNNHFKCDQCDRRCETLTLLADHKHRYHTKRKLACSICNEQFQTQLALMLYM